MPASKILSTDMRCYFGCEEGFKKDFQLKLHLKLKHKNENPDQLSRAYQDAEMEICLVRRNGSTFQCAICQQKIYDEGVFYDHTKGKHNMPWMEYKEKYGRCELESTPFECKICGGVIKYTRNIVHTHLKNVHGLNWEKYLDRIRKMRKGEQPDELPSIEHFNCLVCNSTVKFLKEHVWNVHRLSEMEYEDRVKKMSMGENPGPLPSIETYECKICHVSIKEFNDHIRRCHKITMKEYKELFQNEAQ